MVNDWHEHRTFSRVTDSIDRQPEFNRVSMISTSIMIQDIDTVKLL
jgi:hypothetical protein